MEVFVIVIICVGVCINTIVQDVPFILVREPRIGIITFFCGRLGFESGGIDAQEGVPVIVPRFKWGG